MNFKNKYKRDIQNINIEQNKLTQISNIIKNNNDVQRKSNKKIIIPLVASSVAALLCISILVFKENRLIDKDTVANNTVNSEQNSNESIHKDVNEKKQGLYIPKSEIPTNVEASRIDCISYKGKIYIASYTFDNKNIETGKSLMHTKIGTTWDLKPYIEDNKTSEPNVDLKSLADFASFTPNKQVYTVKAYSNDFRIMTYEQSSNEEFITIYECLNDITVSSGADIYNKLNVKNNIKSVQWDTYNNWNNSKLDLKELPLNSEIEKFINNIYAGMPYSLNDKEIRDIVYPNESNSNLSLDEKYKFMYITLNDNLVVKLRLVKSGYVVYNSPSNQIAIKISEDEMQSLWNMMK